MELGNKILDLAHLNRETFYDSIDLAKNNIIVTHCCIEDYHQHLRNLEDRQIKLVIEHNGLIGLTLVGSFICDNGADIADFAYMIDHFVQSYGYKNLAIGTDYYGTNNIVNGLEDYKDFSFLNYYLIKLGYTQEIVKKIFYGNAKKFFNKYVIE